MGARGPERMGSLVKSWGPDPFGWVPVGQLCHYTLEANEGGGDEPPERLTLAFPTADVVLTGARLGKLVELLHDHSLGSVTPLDARYSNALGKAPWVARILVSRIDKSGGAAG